MFGEDNNPFEENTNEEEFEQEFEFEPNLPDFEFEPIEVGSISSQDEAQQQTCDHASEHKEFLSEQETRGLNLGGFGGSVGVSTTKIGCKKCEKVYEIKESDETDYDLI